MGTGSAPCNPSDLYLRQSSTNTTINATSLVINNDSIRVGWNIPANAPNGVYDLYLEDYAWFSGSCSGFGQISCFIPSAFGIGTSAVSGQVYYDDAQDSTFNVNDLPLPRVRVLLLPDNRMTFTDANGNYSFLVDTGSYTIKLFPPPGFVHVTSDSINVHVDTSNVTGLDFPLYATASAFETEISWSGRPRCNTAQTYVLYFSNQSIFGVNYVIKYFHSSNVIYLNSFSHTPDSINGDTVYFSQLNMPYGSSNLLISQQIPGAGTTIYSGAIVETYDLNSNLIEVDTVMLQQTVGCSFDPNDKAVAPAGDENHYTLFGQTMYYTIRFQNTGNDTAYVVHILDTIDASYDFNTFRLLTSSHPVLVEAYPNTREVDFIFMNIMLPDSNVDEPGSNGFVIYAVDHLPGLPENTTVLNQAHIYFDQNDAVETNITENILVSVLPVGVSEVSQNAFIVYPNPFSRSITFQNKSFNGNSNEIAILDMQGRIISQTITTSEKTDVVLDGVSSGIYLYRITDLKEGNVSYGRIIRR